MDKYAMKKSAISDWIKLLREKGEGAFRVDDKRITAQPLENADVDDFVLKLCVRARDNGCVRMRGWSSQLTALRRRPAAQYPDLRACPARSCSADCPRPRCQHHFFCK